MHTKYPINSEEKKINFTGYFYIFIGSINKIVQNLCLRRKADEINRTFRD